MNDFIKDIKFNDQRDNEDRPFNGLTAPIEFSECNRNYLLEAFNKIKDSAKSILEIGVCRNGSKSSSYVFINNKKNETVYVGVDLEDK